MRRGLMILCLWLAGATFALAERRVALVLGVEDYEILRPLENPVNDARAVESMLEGLGFEVFLETDRDLKRLRRSLDDFREDAAGADVALFFFAGHGVALEGENFLLPTDADASTADALRATGLPLSEVQAALGAVAPVTLMLLDACRNDPFTGGEGRSAVALDGAAPELAVAPGLGRMGRADGALFAFAAAPNETAADGAGDNSPFTEALVRHFGTAGVEVRTALTLVQQDVYDRSRGAQLPYVESGVPELVFLTAQGDLPERDRLLVAMAGLTPDLRAEVEALAAARDMPLAPLYGAVIAADLGGLSAGERELRMVEAADGFAAFRTGLQGLSSDDPEVVRLRAEAEVALTLGAADEARLLLARAVTIDAAALETLTDRVQKRTLSQAQTHMLSAEVSTSDLRYDLALVDLEAARALFATIEGPDLDRAYRTAYTNVLWDIGELHLLLGQTSQALGVFLDRQKVAHARLAEDPTDMRWQRDAMAASMQIGSVLQSTGDFLGAGEQLARALELGLARAAELPYDRDVLRDLMIIYNRVGQFLLENGDDTGAEATFNDGLTIARRIYATFPDDTEAQSDLAFSIGYVASALLRRDAFGPARELLDQGVDLRRALAASAPDNARFRENLAYTLEKRADALTGLKDTVAALTDYQQALDLMLQLTARDPANTELQSDLATLHVNVGIKQVVLGANAAGLAELGKGVGICRALSELDPANVEWQIDLVFCHNMMGIYGPLPDRAFHFRSALDILQRLDGQGQLPEVYRSWLGIIGAQVSAD